MLLVISLLGRLSLIIVESTLIKNKEIDIFYMHFIQLSHGQTSPRGS